MSSFFHIIRGLKPRAFWLVFLGVLTLATMCVFWQPRVYQATGELRHFSSESFAPLGPEAAIESVARGEISKRVVERMSEHERSDFLNPYARTSAGTAEAIGKLINRDQLFEWDNKTSTLKIRYRHPDPRMSAKIVSLIIDEVIAYSARLRIDKAIRAVEELKLRAEQAEREMKQLTVEIEAYLQPHPELTLESREKDQTYREIKRKLEVKESTLKELIGRMRDATMITTVESGSRVVEKPTVPADRDYLFEPIIVNLVSGFAIALVSGLVAGFVFGRRNLQRSQPILGENIL
jgi:uncharacterized protein involved in exopolysaccharide biosynthesis